MSTEVIVAFITGVIGPIMVVLIRNYQEKVKKAKSDIIKDTLHTSELVNAKIEYLREEFKADRVWIIQFHNGGNFYPTGKSMAKFTMLYETVNGSVPSIQNNFQNIPVNLFSKSINHILENDTIIVPDFKDETVATYGLKYIAEENGVKSAYLYSIKSIENKLIGVIGVEYTKKKVKLTQDEISDMFVQASSLSGYLLGNH